MLLTASIIADEIDIIKSNSFPVSKGFIAPGQGLYFNQAAAIAAINIFTRYPNLIKALNAGNALITNLETRIIYKEKYFTNTIQISDNSIKLYEAKMKRSLNRGLIVSLSAVGVAIIGGLLIPNDNRNISSVGYAMAGGAVLTIPVSYLIVRFRKYRGFRNE